jgi:hypothetical protein
MWLKFFLVFAAAVLPILLLIVIAQLNRRMDALTRVSRTEITAYAYTLNHCQALLTERGNEIHQCVDDNEEFANELAEGCARVRTTNPTKGAGRRSGSSPLRSAPRFQREALMGPAATPGQASPGARHDNDCPCPPGEESRTDGDG